MGFFKLIIAGFLLAASGLWSLPVVAGHDAEGTTEKECAQLPDAEIVWDLRKFRWMCCVIKNEDEYENCVLITDMKPLPKTSIIPFPPNSSKAIEPETQKK